MARPIILIVFVAGLVILPSFLWGPGDSHSFKYNYIWTSQFGAEMARGIIYPRWLPDSFEGLGSPTFYFYPPLTFWIAGGLQALGLTTLTAINLTAFIALTLSGLAMYLWLFAARATWPMLGTIAYMAAPYHLMDFYIRGALAEYMAFVWFPLIALAIHFLPDRRATVLLALSYAGLILTHLPLAMLASFFLVLPMALRALWKDRTVFWPLIIGGTLGLALSAFYLLSALTLQDVISVSLMWTPWYQPSSWFILTPHNLLPDDAIPALSAGAVLLVMRVRSIWTTITVLGALATLGLIPFIWDMEPLVRAQFPWRLLCIVEFAAITALAFHTRIPRILLGLGSGLILYSYIIWIPQMARNLKNPPSHDRIAREQPDAPEYLPLGFDLKQVRDNDRETNLTGLRQLPRGDHIRIGSAGDVTIGHADFPIWRVTRDGKPVPHGGPLIHFRGQPGEYRIERQTIWQESAGAAISAFAALLLFAIGWSGRRGGRTIAASRRPA